MTNYGNLGPVFVMVHDTLYCPFYLQGYLTQRMEKSHNRKTDLVVYCNEQSQASKNVDRTQSEGTSSTSEFMEFARIILSSAEFSCLLYIFRWSFIWAYQLCREIRGKVCSSLRVRSLEVNPVSFLQGTAKVSSRKYTREWISQFYSLWRCLPA